MGLTRTLPNPPYIHVIDTLLRRLEVLLLSVWFYVPRPSFEIVITALINTKFTWCKANRVSAIWS